MFAPRPTATTSHHVSFCLFLFLPFSYLSLFSFFLSFSCVSFLLEYFGENSNHRSSNFKNKNRTSKLHLRILNCELTTLTSKSHLQTSKFELRTSTSKFDVRAPPLPARISLLSLRFFPYSSFLFFFFVVSLCFLSPFYTFSFCFLFHK